jgi:AraC-like DNA-binding protein
MEPTGEVSWARLAAENDYADQSHMAREFREFSGTTLTAYRRELHPMSDQFHAAPIDVEPNEEERSGMSDLSKTGHRLAR